jgi:hypothetical protein
MNKPNTLEELECIYKEMNDKWINNPEQWRIEPRLCDDPLRCFAIYSRDSIQCEPLAWQRLQAWLKPLLEYGLAYRVDPSDSEGLLHFTLHQCSRFDSNLSDVYRGISTYKKDLDEFLKKLSGFQMVIRGLVITPTGIALRGFPIDDHQLQKLMNLRNLLYTFFPSIGIPFDPPYNNDICHLTLFRWIKPPTRGIIEYIQRGIQDWNECIIGNFKAYSWNIGYCTFKMNDRYIEPILCISTPFYIAHRALTNGADIYLENRLDILMDRIKCAQYSECDIWYINNKLYLGHDRATTEIDISALMTPYLLLHMKNREALEYFLELRRSGIYNFNIFWHTTEDYVISSLEDIIVFPGKEIISHSIYMMPENDLSKRNSNKKISQICSDYKLETKARMLDIG